MQNRQQVAANFNRKEIVEYYEQLAVQYGLLQVEHILIDRYLQHKDAWILDVGCGTGREAFPLQHQGYPVVGLDLAWNMVHKAQEKRQCIRIQASRLFFHQADAVILPYRDQSFETALMLSQILQHIPKRQNRQRALREVFRILKPRGHLILSVFNRPVSALYLMLITRTAVGKQKLSSPFLQRCQTLGSASSKPHWRYRLAARIVKKCLWEVQPAIWSLSSPLPVLYRATFSLVLTGLNLQRRVRLALNMTTLEPNDLMLSVPDFQIQVFSKNGIFAHFPDADEVIADLSRAGFQLVEYRSLEELQQERNFSDTLRRSKRLLFYVAQKRC